MSNVTQEWCRLCGKVGELTIEHTPPRGAFNKGRGRQLGLDEWLKRDNLDDLRQGVPFQGGSKAPTLCDSCNNFCGVKYVKEYVEWVHALSAMIRQEVGDEPELPQGAFMKFSVKDRFPGRFVRQVLAMFLCQAPNRQMREEHPQLVRAVQYPETTEPMDPLRLYMLLYLGPNARATGSVSAVLDTETRRVSLVQEIAHPPFAFLLSFEGGDPSGLGADISELTKIPSSERVSFSGEFNVGHGLTALPADYRSLERIEQESAASKKLASGTDLPPGI